MISRLGRFELQDEIGRGGFGQVFRATDPIMNRVVAVKVLTATEDASSFNRFKNEATAAGNLRHENIVTVYEFGHEGNIPFLVMEYLDGEDLHHIIKHHTPLTLYQKVRILDQVADGLHCAHRNGVLHRDIKPANIMLLNDGIVKIMDFGIARLTRDTSTRLTQQGYLVGTVIYMAPELLSGAETEVDALCDIWSYGVVMYELLTGVNPFQTGSLQSEMFRIFNHQPTPLPAGDCRADLQAVIDKLLSRPRELRYQSLEDTRFDLQPILKSLEKAEVDRLVSQAEQLMFRRQLDEALAAVRKARKLDPQNGAARIIFERIQDETRKQSVRPRIDDLLRRSNLAAEQRDFPEALAHLQAALKLDPSNAQLSARVQELHSLKVHLEEAAALVGEAGSAFHDGRLTEAFAHASEALSHDPTNPQARQLLKTIQDGIETRHAERALDAELLRARGLMAVNDLPAALDALQAAESKYYPRADLLELAARIAQLVADRQGSREFSQRLEQAKDMVRAARFEDAVRELEKLPDSFRQRGEANDLLVYARQELKANKRTDEVQRITGAVAELTRTQRFDEAIPLIENGLKTYPDELSLTRLLRATHAELQAFERDRALRAGVQRCRDLQQRGQLQPALDFIALLISDNPEHQELLQLAVEIKQEKSRADRAAGVRNAVDHAAKLLQDGRPDLAVSIVDAAILAVGADPELAALLKKAEDAQQSQHDRQSIQAELKHATVFEERGDIATSLKIVEGALRRYPKSSDLLAAKERLSNAATPVPTEPEAPQKITRSLRPAPELATRSEIQLPKLPPQAPPEPAPEHHAQAGPKWRLYAIAGVVLAGLAGLALWFLQPTTRIAPENLSFAGANPPAQTITVTGADSLPDPKTGESWLHFTRHNLASGKTEFRVEVSPAGLAPGTHAADLVFPSQKVHVKFLVPSVAFQPASLMFSYSPAGIPPQKLLVAIPSGIPDPVPSERWVTFTRHNLGPGKAELDVRVSATGLAAGPHNAFLAFPPDKKVPVELMIPGGATLEVYPAFLTFPAGGPQQRVIVTAPGAIPDPKPSEPWVTFNRVNVSPGKAEFLVQVSPQEVEAATGKKYAALVFSPERKVTVEIAAPGAGPATLELQPDSLAFPDGGTQQTISVTAPGAIPDPKSTDPWVTFTRLDPEPGKAEFLVKASPAGLESGPHVAYLTFTPQKQVRIELTVAGPKPLNVQPAELHFRYKRGGPPPQPQIITASGPPDIPDPTKKAPWLQVTRSNPSKSEFTVQILPDKLGPDSTADDVVFSPQKKVRVAVLVMDTPDTAPAASGIIFWSGGTLNPGDELWIKEQHTLHGPGTVNGRLPKANLAIDRSKLPATIRVVDEPSQDNGYTLRLHLVSGPPVFYLSIPWTLKK